MPLQLQVRQTGLEKSIQEGMKKAGRNLKLNLGNTRNIDALSQPLGRLTGKADEFTKSMEAANARVLAFGASVGVIAAVTKGMQELVRTTIEVEKSLANINSILRQSDAQMSSFKDTLFDVARNTEQTFSSVAEAALELSRQGLKAEEVTNRLNDSLILSRLSGMSAADSVAGLTAAINSFSSAGITSAEVLNKISAAAASAAVSDRDLIEGLKRSGAVAVSTGVEFDQLVGIIGALQEKTARGGAVIGNSLKTIFTRIQDIDKLNSLQDLGVEVTNLQGDVLSANKVIENLAPVFAKLDQASKVNLADNLVGKFQIAPFLSLLEQYNEEVVRSNEIAKTSFGATNEAYQRNIALNNTLSAALNKAVVNLKELGNTLGEIGVTDNLKNVLGFFNSIAESLQGSLDGEGAGSTFAKGLVKGIGAILSGPGLVLLGAIVTKLAFGFVKFGTSSLKTFFGLNQAAKEHANLQGQITAALLNDSSIRQDILHIENKSISVEEKRKQQAEALTTAMNAQLTVMKQMQSISKGITPSVAANTKAARRASGGFLPIGAESSDIARGVGGAPSSAKPVVIPNFAFGGGKRGTMVANSSEYIVPNYANGGDAIFNQSMASSMGLPANAKKVRAASGYIPNFAKPENMNMSAVLSKIGGKRFQEKLANGKLTKEDKAILAQKDKLEAAAVGKRSYMANSNPKSILLVPNHKVPFNLDGADHPFQSPYASKLNGEIDFFEGAAAGIDPDLKNSESEDARKLSGLVDLDDKIAKNLAKGVNDIFSEFKNAVGFKTDPNVVTKDNIKDTMESGGPGAFGAIKGATFEALMQAISGGVSQKAAKGGGELDVVFSRDQSGYLETVFGIKDKGYKFADFKNSLGQKGKYVRQVVDNVKGNINVSKNAKLSTSGKKGNAASGYIPNFADPLQDAIGREQTAGLPVSQIRINQSGKLRNSQNPMGLAVTNTRDEPTGAIPAARGFIPNFFNLEQARQNLSDKQIAAGFGGQEAKDELKKLGASAKKTSKSFKEAKKTVDINRKGQTDLTGVIFGVGAGLTALEAATAGSESALARYTSIISGSLASISNFAFAGKAVSDMGNQMKLSGGKFKGAIGGAVGKLGAYGAAIGAGIEIFKLGSSLYDEASGANERATTALAFLTDATKDLSNSFSSLDAVLKDKINNQVDDILNAPVRSNSLSGDFRNIKEEFLSMIGMSDYRGELGMTKMGFETDDLEQGVTSALKEMRGLGFSSKYLKGRLSEFGDKVDSEEATSLFKELAKAAKDTEVYSKKLAELSDIDVQMLTEQQNNKDQFGTNLTTDQRFQLAEKEVERRKKEDKKGRVEMGEAIDLINLKNAKAGISAAVELAKLKLQAKTTEERSLEMGEAAGTLTRNQLKELKEFVALRKLENELSIANLSVIGEQTTALKGVKGKTKEVSDLTETLNRSIEDGNFSVEDREEALGKISKILAAGEKVAEKELLALQKILLKQEVLTNEKRKQLGLDIKQANILEDNANRVADARADRGLGSAGDFNEKDLKLQKEILDLQKTQRSLSAGSSNTRFDAFGQERNFRGSIESVNRQIAEKQGERSRLSTIKSFREMPLSNKIISRLQDPYNNGNSLEKSLLKSLPTETDPLKIGSTLRLLSEAGGLEGEEKTNFEKSIQGFEKSLQDNTEQTANSVDATKNLTLTLAQTGAQNVARASVLEKFSKSEAADLKRLGEAQQKTGISGLPEDIAREAKMKRGFRQRVTESTDTSLEASDKLKDNLVSASRQFVMNMDEAFRNAISSSDSLGDALLEISKQFLSDITSAYSKKFLNKAFGDVFGVKDKATGGFISGGSGHKDDVPAMLMGGEFVMRKSAVQKYGAGFFNALNSGGVQGYASGGSVRQRRDKEGLFRTPSSSSGYISGVSDLMSFATQSPNRMGGDSFVSGGATAAFLDPESARLSMFGRRSSQQFGKVQDAKKQAFDLAVSEMGQMDQARIAGKESSSQFFKDILSAGISAGLGGLGADMFKGNKFLTAASGFGSNLLGTAITGGGASGFGNFGAGYVSSMQESGSKGLFDFLKSLFSNKQATGGMISSSTGVDTVPTMLSGGEFIMNASATKRLGAGNLQALNSGSGGGGDNSQLVGKLDELISATEDATGGEINITINSEGKENVKTSEGASEDQKRLSERIKTVVKQVITDEKRLGGQLRK